MHTLVHLSALLSQIAAGNHLPIKQAAGTFENQSDLNSRLILIVVSTLQLKHQIQSDLNRELVIGLLKLADGAQ